MTQEYINIAINQLDYLDPILGFDLKWVYDTHKVDEAESLRMLKIVHKECQVRANVHAPGTLRQGWNNVLDALGCAMELSCR